MTNDTWDLGFLALVVFMLIVAVCLVAFVGSPAGTA